MSIQTIHRKPFHPDHLNFLKLRLGYENLLALEATQRALNNIPDAPQGGALSLAVDEKLIACFGFFLVLPGIAQVWLLPSIYLDEYPVTFVRVVKRYIEQTADIFGWHRVQTITEVNDQHRRWMKVLGFVEEGIMRQYLDKRDYVMSARYFERG